MRSLTTPCESDLLIIGGGPAGLSAAINGASEGLSVRMLDGGTSLGGQAKESAAIENYPGFPDGITGEALMGSFVKQSLKFKASMVANISAAQLRVDSFEGKRRFIITTDDYQEYIGRSILLSLGLSYRRLQADGLAPLMGRGAFYGRPLGMVPPTKKCEVAIVGGANSAGQCVVNLASNPKVHVRLYIRKTIGDQMSTYLIERIKALSNVDICEHCEVTAAKGGNRLESITVLHNDSQTKEEVDIDSMFIFIGATPRTLWLANTGIELDDSKYIKAWDDVTQSLITDKGIQRDLYPFETSQRGVFVAGDVRSGSTKRIASAIGEGAGALPMIHKYLGALGEDGV